MPYIPKETRETLEPNIKQLAAKIKKPGDYNYVISRLYIEMLLQEPTRGYHERSKWLAAVTDASTEIRRRLVDPYEDGAIAKNGDLAGLEELSQ